LENLTNEIEEVKKELVYLLELHYGSKEKALAWFDKKHKYFEPTPNEYMKNDITNAKSALAFIKLAIT